MSHSDADDERPAGAQPDDSDARPDDAAAREAAAWQAIVDNYGEHPSFEDPDDAPDAHPGDPRPAEASARSGAGRLDLHDEPSTDTDGSTGDLEDHFVPPPPPPVPRTTPPRMLAWLGLFGVPALTLVALVAGVGLPSWLGVVLMGWFVGGFVFLVASMRPGPRDDLDDGAVL